MCIVQIIVKIYSIKCDYFLSISLNPKELSHFMVKLFYCAAEVISRLATRKMYKDLGQSYFFYEKDSRFNPRLIHHSSFLIGQVPTSTN